MYFSDQKWSFSENELTEINLLRSLKSSVYEEGKYCWWWFWFLQWYWRAKSAKKAARLADLLCSLLCESQRPKLQLYFVICNGYLAVGHDVFYDSDDEKTTCLLLFSLEEIISYRWGSGRSNEKVTFFVVHKLIEYADGINTAHNLKKKEIQSFQHICLKPWQNLESFKIKINLSSVECSRVQLKVSVT